MICETIVVAPLPNQPPALTRCLLPISVKPLTNKTRVENADTGLFNSVPKPMRAVSSFPVPVRFLVALAGSLTMRYSGAGESSSGARGSKTSRPNLVLMVADDLRVDAIRTLGRSMIRTAHLESFVRAGVSFTKAICSYSPCIPSRAELVPGCTGFRNRVFPQCRSGRIWS